MMKNNIKKVLVMLILIFTVTCKEDEFGKIKKGDFDIVSKGKYRGKLSYLNPGSEYEDQVNEWRSKIEENIQMLPMITEKFFVVPHRLTYRFKFAALDKEKDCCVLRYFARIVEHPIYAGYQIQCVFDIKSKRLLKIFTVEVPLE